MSFVSERLAKEKFRVLSGETTVREAIAMLQRDFGRPPRCSGDTWGFEYIHLIVTLPEGRYALLESSTGGEFQRRLEAAADKIGRALLDMPLARVPDLCQPAAVVELTDDEMTVRAKHGKPPSLAVVLEDGQPVGVFWGGRQGPPRSSFESRFPTRLFGPAMVFVREEHGGEKRRCPVCHADFGYFKPVQLGEAWQYHCPHCDADLTASLELGVS